jgi:hypothetical protein
MSMPHKFAAGRFVVGKSAPGAAMASTVGIGPEHYGRKRRGQRTGGFEAELSLLATPEFDDFVVIAASAERRIRFAGAPRRY